jgi:Flp pilus assembly pilin Flp
LDNSKEKKMIAKLMPYAVSLKNRLWTKEEAGQTMIEYMLLIVLIALAVFVTIPSISAALRSVISEITSALRSTV